MATQLPSVQALREQLDQIDAEYNANFAGQSRVTRDLAVLNDLVARTNRVKAELSKLDTSVLAVDLGPMKDAVLESLKLYEAERKEIMKAKSVGPQLVAFDTLRTQANMVFATYRRHFAGQARNTRDLGLLGELLEDLKLVREGMAKLAPTLPGGQGVQEDLKLVTDNQAMYSKEREEIAKARTSGDLETQAGTLATCANGQFQVYTTHFAGKSRMTRRPGLLQRVIDGLTLIQTGMRSLKAQGLSSEPNDRNVEIVEENLRMYKGELEEIRKARQAASIGDLQGQLGGAANEVFKQYTDHFAGKDRATRDLNLLGNLADQLSEIARQMRDLGRASANETNDRNLQIVTEQRVMYEREYSAIAEVQQAKARN